MTILDRYLYRQFIKNLLLVFCSLVAIYLLIDFFERIDNFIGAQLPLSLALRYFLLKIPLIGEQLTPVCIMLAGVITVGLLHHRKELQSLQATGIRLGRITRPVLQMGFLGVLLALAASQWLLPNTQQALNSIWYGQVNHQQEGGTLRNGMLYYHGKEGFYTMKPGKKEQFQPFTYLGWDSEYRFTQQVVAATATRTTSGWQLRQGRRKKLTDGIPTVRPFNEQLVTFPEPPAQLFVPEYTKSARSLSAIWRAVKNGEHGAWHQLNARISYIALALPLLAIGIPTLLTIARHWGKDLSLAIPVSCGMAFAVWGLWGILQSFAKAEALPVVPALWSPHLLLPAITLLLSKIRS